MHKSLLFTYFWKKIQSHMHHYPDICLIIFFFVTNCLKSQTYNYRYQDNNINNVILGRHSLYFMRDSQLFLCLSLPIQMQCLTTSRHFSIILSASSKQQINNASNKYLIINRRTNKINEISKEEYQSRVQSIAFTHIVKFYNLIGTIIVNNEPFLVVATSISQVAKYIEYPIYIINDV